MSQTVLTTVVLNPCPTCGKSFDVNGCMTLVAEFLQHATSGKCPGCATQVVVQEERYLYSKEWAEEGDPVRLRQIRIETLGLSVRTTNSLEQMGVRTVGQLLETKEHDIRQAFKVCEPVIAEVGKLLAARGLSLRFSVSYRSPNRSHP